MTPVCKAKQRVPLIVEWHLPFSATDRKVEFAHQCLRPKTKEIKNQTHCGEH